MVWLRLISLNWMNRTFKEWKPGLNTQTKTLKSDGADVMYE